MHPYLLSNFSEFCNQVIYFVSFYFNTVLWHKPLNFRDESTVLSGYFQVCMCTAYQKSLFKQIGI